MATRRRGRRRQRLLGLLAAVAAACASPVASDGPEWRRLLEKGREATRALRVEEAGVVLERALALARQDAARPWAVPLVQFWLADLYYEAPFAPGAERIESLLRESDAGWRRLAGPQAAARIAVLNLLSNHQLTEGRQSEGEATFEEARRLALALPAVDREVVEAWRPGAILLRREPFFEHTLLALRRGGTPPGGGPAASCPSPTDPPRLAAPVDAGDTYLQPLDMRRGPPTYVHVTEIDMPWRIAVPRPRQAPRYGSTQGAREAVVEGIRLWEAALQPHVPWFHLEFVEEDPSAPVQVEWKRRVPGPWGAFGGPTWTRIGGCLRVGGRMELAVRPGTRLPLETGDLRRIAAHEFGHVLGLGHCHACDSIMNYAERAPEITDLDVRTFLRLLEVPNGAVVAGSAAGRAP